MEIDLHDATLERIEVLWQAKVCQCFVRAWHDGASRALRIEFREITDVSIPHAEPWGRSNSILEHVQDADTHAITMQSGDVIRLRAKSWSVVGD